MGELTNHIAAGRNYDLSTVHGTVLSAVLEVSKARESSYWDTTGVDDACLEGMQTITFHAVMRYLPEMTRQAINAWPNVADVYSDGDDSVRARLNADQTVTVTCLRGYQSIASMLNKVNERVAFRCKRDQVRDAVVAMRAVPFTDGVLSTVPWIVDLQKNKREIRFVLSPVWFYGITEMMPSPLLPIEEECALRMNALREMKPESCTGPWVAFECAHGRIVFDGELVMFDAPEVMYEYLDVTPAEFDVFWGAAFEYGEKHGRGQPAKPKRRTLD